MGSLFMLLLILAIAFLSVRVNIEEAPRITFISLSGNTHLDVEDYFKFTRLDEKEKYKYLSVNIIKDRFEKHPYVETASVKLEPDNKVYVQISEKTFEAIITQYGRNFFLSEEFELLPFMFGTHNVDYPLIRGLSRKDTIKTFSIMYDDPEIKTALKIMAATELIDKNLYANISEIVCSGEKGIELYFNNLDFPVLLGDGEVIRKMVYFGKMWAYFDGKLNNAVVDYIDLRYDKHVFLGFDPGQLEGQSS